MNIIIKYISGMPMLEAVLLLLCVVAVYSEYCTTMVSGIGISDRSRPRSLDHYTKINYEPVFGVIK